MVQAKQPDCVFDAVEHRYTMDGRPVPSDTQILREILGENWHSGEWHMARGRAVHACCALLARGKVFWADPQCVGQIAAWEDWRKAAKPQFLLIETPMFSRAWQYAGTPDAICRIDGRLVVVDYKANITPDVDLQVAGYAILADQYKEEFGGVVMHGMGVQLHEDGKYKATPVLPLRDVRGEFLALRSAYGSKQKRGLIKPRKGEVVEDER